MSITLWGSSWLCCAMPQDGMGVRAVWTGWGFELSGVDGTSAAAAHAFGAAVDVVNDLSVHLDGAALTSLFSCL